MEILKTTSAYASCVMDQKKSQDCGLNYTEIHTHTHWTVNTNCHVQKGTTGITCKITLLLDLMVAHLGLCTHEILDQDIGNIIAEFLSA